MKLSDLEQFNRITIQCHDNPDADTLASGYGLYCFFQSRDKQTRLVYSGRNQIQKSNLKLMVEKLNLPVEYIPAEQASALTVEGLLITVDCQYGAGNVTKLAAENVAVIDHHQAEIRATEWTEIHPGLGSCSTLVWKMLTEEGFEVSDDRGLGTALYYGLYSDTNQFSELHNPLDMDMIDELPVDDSLITLFRNSNISLKELEIAGIALIRYSYNDDYEFAVIKAQPCDPNILGLISDFLLQVDAIKTCVVFNEVNDGYKFSVRSCVREVNASELAAYLAEGMGSGGGHYEKAGGFTKKTIFNEDMIIAAHMVRAGYRVAYAAKARVVHSHNYTGIQQFRRNFDLAVSQADHPEVFEEIRSESEGIRMVKQTMRYLCRSRKAYLLPSLVYKSGCKYAGYRLGRYYRKLPQWMILRCTANRLYWMKS